MHFKWYQAQILSSFFTLVAHNLQKNETGNDVGKEGHITWEGVTICTWVCLSSGCVFAGGLTSGKACVHQCKGICVGACLCVECVCSTVCICALVEDVIPNKALIVSLWGNSLSHSVVIIHMCVCAHSPSQSPRHRWLRQKTWLTWLMATVGSSPQLLAPSLSESTKVGCTTTLILILCALYTDILIFLFPLYGVWIQRSGYSPLPLTWGQSLLRLIHVLILSLQRGTELCRLFQGKSTDFFCRTLLAVSRKNKVPFSCET